MLTDVSAVPTWITVTLVMLGLWYVALSMAFPAVTSEIDDCRGLPAGQIDGTLAHALKRAIPLSIANAAMYTTDTNWTNSSHGSCLASAVIDDYALAVGNRPADF